MINQFAPPLEGPAPRKHLEGPAPKKGLENSTISDDRSIGSNLEARSLVALLDRSMTPSVYSVPSLGPRRREMLITTGRSEASSDSSLGGELDHVPEEEFGGHAEIIADDHWMEHVPTNATQSLNANYIHDPSTEHLNQRITELQDEIRKIESLKQTKSPTMMQYEVVYRVDGTCYFDHPEWTQARTAIVSRVPVQNLDLFLERNKHVLFIVYRDFYGVQEPQLGSAIHRPRHIKESICPTNMELLHAIVKLLQEDWRYNSFLKLLNETGELMEPYLFIYHSRSHWEHALHAFPSQVRDHLDAFTRYVMRNYGKEYDSADALFNRRKVSVDYVKYLFKPGDILVSRSNGECQGLMARSWPESELESYRSEILSSANRGPIGERNMRNVGSQQRVEKENKVFRGGRAQSAGPHGSASYQEGLIHPEPLFQKKNLGESAQATDPSRSPNKFPIHVWKWSFDGDFKRTSEEVVLHLSQKADSDPKEAVEWNMHDIDIYPLKFAPLSLVEQLRRRGEMFWKCRKRCLISYQEDGAEAQNDLDERFMIDYHTFRKLHPGNWSYSLNHSDTVKTMSQEDMARDDPLEESFLYLVPVQTKGFNMRTKKWLDLNVDQIRPVVWNTKAFDALVLEKKTKELITALVSKQISSAKSTDVIAGKGNGLILLLHGGPGTGKTLTAEGVAEIAKKPLYRVTCGDIGTKAKDVEKYLESVLHLGKIWDCVVLLDEAEVFLERRSLDDLQRNALVSVFLRVIEYHEGILILTSNRVGTFDEAFRSRIQIAVHYPPLHISQRRRIWNNFIDRLASFNDGAVDVGNLRDHIEELKDNVMNGRQIRNAITTARQYAEWKGEIMDYEHLKTALEVAGKFDTYSEKLRGGLTDDQIAEEEGIR